MLKEENLKNKTKLSLYNKYNMNFYVVVYPERKLKVFTELRDAKNSLSNLWEMHQWAILHYEWDQIATISWINNGKTKTYIYTPI